MARAMATVAVRRLVAASAPRPAVAAARKNVDGNRLLHSSGPKQMAEHGHGHGHGGEGSMYANNEYIHAPHMYDFKNMKNKKLKMGLFVFGSLSFGIAVPIYATHFHL